MEECVDEKYYLSEKFYNCIVEHSNRKISEGCGFKTQFVNIDGTAGTITTKYGQRSTDPYIIQNGFERNNFAFVSYTREKKGNVVDRHLKDVANTVHTSTGSGGNTDSYVVETFIPEPSEMIGVSVHPLSHKMEFKGAESIKSDASPTLRATDYKCPPTVWEMDEESYGNNLSSGYRIRKLTPREVFRLMDVDDADIDKIQSAGISNSQQYKMAGNSIVVDVLYYIFKNLFIEKSSKRYLQLKLF